MKCIVRTDRILLKWSTFVTPFQCPTGSDWAKVARFLGNPTTCRTGNKEDAGLVLESRRCEARPAQGDVLEERRCHGHQIMVRSQGESAEELRWEGIELCRCTQSDDVLHLVELEGDRAVLPDPLPHLVGKECKAWKKRCEIVESPLSS